MKYTSAQANKLLKKLNDTYQSLLQEEEQSSTFLAAMGEDPETLRPDYVYADTQDSLWEIRTSGRRSSTPSTYSMLLIPLKALT